MYVTGQLEFQHFEVLAFNPVFLSAELHIVTPSPDSLWFCCKFLHYSFRYLVDKLRFLDLIAECYAAILQGTSSAAYIENGFRSG